MRTLSLKRACEIASWFHGGQHSPLYQFCSSGIIVNDDPQNYVREISHIDKSTLTKTGCKNLDKLSRYFLLKTSYLKA